MNTISRFIDICRIIRKSKERHHPGFTLLEILLAIFILGIIVSTIYTAYSGTFSIVDRTTKEAEIYAMARIAMERIVEDLESTYIPYIPDASKDYGFNTTEDQVGNKTFPHLEFFSRAHLTFCEALKEDTIAQINYYVKEGDTDEVFALCRSDQTNFNGLRSGISLGPVLCEGLTDVAFTYYDAAGTIHDHWNSSEVPVMVTVQLSFLNASDPETPYMFTTGVAIPVGRR